MHTIYSLIDQRTDVPFYIGITEDVYQRFLQHLQCNESNLDKNERIQELKDHNLMLIMRTIEVVETLEEARDREQHWIHHYLAQGVRLLNIDISKSFSFEDFQMFFEQKPKKVPPPPVKKGRGEAQQRALRILKRNPGIGAAELSKKAHIARSYANRILSQSAAH